MPAKLMRARLDRLARSVTRSLAECPACGGSTRPAVRVRFEHQPPRPVEPCPRCNRTSEVIEVVFVDEVEDAPHTAAA